MLLLLLSGSLLQLAATKYDMGPTYGRDYGGGDYQTLSWHSKPDRSANHYESVANECRAACEQDNRCCAWTYATPELKSVGDRRGERSRVTPQPHPLQHRHAG